MMKRRKLFMIGNSHIDPVWFWDWEEGMQEVKATFLSALERLREFPEMKFTCTSTAFLEWFEKVEPERFEEIRQRAAEPAGIIRRKGMTCSHGYRSQGKEFIIKRKNWNG